VLLAGDLELQRSSCVFCILNGMWGPSPDDAGPEMFPEVGEWRDSEKVLNFVGGKKESALEMQC